MRCRPVCWTCLLPVTIAPSCTTVEYTPPALDELEHASFRTEVDRGYEEVWDALVAYVSAGPLVPHVVEKDSGLITASFGETEASRFATGGSVLRRGTFLDAPAGRSFSGDWLDYALAQRPAFEFEGLLSVLVRARGARTVVDVRVRYLARDLWSEYAFDSKSHATLVELVAGAFSKGAGKRYLRPTHVLENEALQAAREPRR